MNLKVQYISINKIQPVENLEISHIFQKRMKQTEEFLTEYDLLLAVEKNTDKSTYVLVGGYDRYKYLISSGYKTAPCLIEKSSIGKQEQTEKILRRLFNKGDSSKVNKQKLLTILSNMKIDLDKIAKVTSLTKSEILNSYRYHKNIPKEYINENTTEKTLNWVESLSLNQEVKEYLFQSAGLPVGNPKRLTQENMKIIKKFLKNEPRFYYLSTQQQINVLTCAITFKGMVIEYLNMMVSNYTKTYSIV